jgi:mannosyl-3-phosphoglycerate phosphatase family protein
MSRPPAVLFTDLDGTLLDLETYQAGPAADALRRVTAAGVAVYFCSSKTHAEQVAIADSLSLDVGMIVENGAAVYADGYEVAVFGAPYEMVREGLQAAAIATGATVHGYGDMDIGEVMDRTGLDHGAAQRACARSYTESFVLENGDPQLLAAALGHKNLRLVRGARFWTVQGDHDKGTAVGHVLDRTGAVSFAIGDHDNDVEMLRAVDRPMVVQRPAGNWSELPVPGLQCLSGIGPQGWLEGAESVLDWVGSM